MKIYIYILSMQSGHTTFSPMSAGSQIITSQYQNWNKHRLVISASSLITLRLFETIRAHGQWKNQNIADFLKYFFVYRERVFVLPFHFRKTIRFWNLIFLFRYIELSTIAFLALSPNKHISTPLESFETK